ncbi:MAG: hypothetical protein JWP87_4132 [Labilithrix sp.]|nr:hypothetical protein [Labilithrix sp.]
MKIRVLLVACSFVVAHPDMPASAQPQPSPALLLDDPQALHHLEANGYAFDAIVSPAKKRAFVAKIAEDMAEFTRGATPESVRRPFQIAWLERGRFELVGVVNRFDRRLDPLDAPSCGEVRLVYRLALDNPGRPTTRLPMTVNVRFPQADRGGCRKIAETWLSGRDVLTILRDLPPFTRLETNFQSIHVPSYRLDMDDNAEYVMRTFKVAGDGLVPDTLTNTPRDDLGADEVAALARWVRENIAAIDAGTALVPEKFLAMRSVSVSPRGLLHVANRPFSRHFPDALVAFGHALATSPPRERAQTPELLLRRLDEATCVGCHQSRGVAGFHLLGEERDRAKTFNALAVGHSPHLAAELPWRAEVLAASSRGEPLPRSRPFSGRADGPGVAGAECGLAPGFEAWTCAPGLSCREMQQGSLGVCAPDSGSRPGDPCETVTSEPSARPEGPVVTSHTPDATCPALGPDTGSRPFCAPNWLGFTGGMCSAYCTRLGEVDGGAICAPLPAARYEADCFYSREPVERCLKRHFIKAKVATCDAERACRDDFACTRVPGAPDGLGACVPPYFVFQVRVDGPVLDR